MRATLGESLPIQIQASSGETDLFGRAKIYDLSGTNIASLSLTHIENGLYGTTYTFNSAGHYTIVYQLFLDSLFTNPANFDIEAEIIEANSDKTNLTRILGLTHDNTVLDNHIYDLAGNLTSARVRSYDTKANAQSAGVTGLQHTWSITAVYSGGKLTNYSVVRES